jgi:hypothetical protein
VPNSATGTPPRLMTDRRDLIYVAGYVDIGFVMEHAWGVTADGIVIDPTLKDPAKIGGLSQPSGYFGIPFQHANGGAIPRALLSLHQSHRSRTMPLIWISRSD